MGPNPYFFFVPAGIFFALAAALFVRRWTFTQRATRAVGTVVSHAAHTSRGRRHTSLRYHPVVRYTVDGTEHQLVSSVGDGAPRYQLGTELTVLYDPARPDAGVIDSIWDLHFGAVLCAIIGGLSVGCAFAFLFVNR